LNFRTAQYSLYVDGATQHILGIAAADRLLFAAALEAIRMYPGVMAAMFTQGFTLLGISVEGMSAVAGNPFSIPRWQRLYPVWSVPDYSHVPFNVGGCAAMSLPDRMMAEYRLDVRLTDTAFARRTIVLAGIGRNVVRACSGTLLLLGWWLLLFGQRRALTVPLLLALGCLVLTVGIGVGGGNSKYDLGFMPLLLVVAVAITTEAARLMKRRIHQVERRREPVLGRG
jgi:hypothetical protein